MAETIAVTIANYAAETFGADAIATFLAAKTAIEVATVVASVYTIREQQRRAQNAQRDAYNASLRDRYVMVRGATEARQLVLGRQRVSGPITFIASHGANKEHLAVCVVLAAHEIDAIEDIYFDDERVILDGAGNVVNVVKHEVFSLSVTGGTYTITTTPNAATVAAWVDYGTTRVTLSVSVSGTAITVSGGTAGQTGTLTISYQPATSPYAPTQTNTGTTSISLNSSGNGAVTLSTTPVAGSVAVVKIYGGDGGSEDLTSYATVSGAVVTVTGAPVVSDTATVTWQYISATASKARIRQYLGAAGQAADAGLITAYPGVWTSAHTMSGMAYLVLECDYDTDAFPQGIPNVSATIRGAKVFDPRTNTTAWSENAALLMRAAATHALCGRLDAAMVDDASVIVAANACDTTANYLVNGQAYLRPLYTAGLSTKSGTRAQDVLTDLAQAMAGRWAFIDGQLRIKAGTWATPLQTLDETWLSDSASVHIQPHPNRADVYNVVTGTFANESGDYQVQPFPRVEAAAYITEDGAELPMQVALGAVTFVGQAQQVIAAQMRDARQGLRVTLTCNMRAYRVEVFDVIRVTIARFGWLEKLFEVLDATWSVDGIQLTLKETDPSIWDMGLTFSDVDPAPNTSLPSPFKVQDVTGLAADSSAAVQLKMADGTIVQRIAVSWDAITDPAVLDSGGGVELRFGRAGDPDSAWLSIKADGAQRLAYITGAHLGTVYQIKARAYNVLVSGAWCLPITHTAGLRSQVGAVVSALSLSAATLPADASGVVLSYAGAATTMSVTRAGADDSGSWAFSRTNSSGVSSTLVGNVCTVTAMSAGVDTGYVDITATRSGYPTQGPLRLYLSKAKQGNTGGSNGPIAALMTTYSTHYVSSGTASCSVLYNTDGTVSGSHLENPGAWYGPTGGTPGNSYWVKFHRQGGDAPTGGSALDTWLQLSTARGPSLSNSVAGTDKQCTLQVLIASDSAGATIVAAGIAYLLSQNAT